MAQPGSLDERRKREFSDCGQEAPRYNQAVLADVAQWVDREAIDGRARKARPGSLGEARMAELSDRGKAAPRYNLTR